MKVEAKIEFFHLRLISRACKRYRHHIGCVLGIAAESITRDVVFFATTTTQWRGMLTIIKFKSLHAHLPLLPSLISDSSFSFHSIMRDCQKYHSALGASCGSVCEIFNTHLLLNARASKNTIRRAFELHSSA
jgi:hypothetical protein